MDLQQLIDQARESLLFTAPILGKDLQRFLEEHGEKLRQMAQQALAENVRHIYWVGSGNSWVNLLSGKMLLDKFSDLTSDCLPSYEFVTRDPQRLNDKAWVFLASFSGATEDTVDALRHANAKGATTIAFTDKADSIMGQEADEVIAYNSKALYLLPLAGAYVFALEVARLGGAAEAKTALENLHQLPALLSQQYVDEEKRAQELARQYASESTFYVLGTGLLYGLAYKFGPTVFMENMRVHGIFIDAPEFRHGPVEMLDKEQPVMVILKGTDATRPMVERVQRIAEQGGARLIVYDVADYPAVHPLLAPFALMIPLQWFAVYSSILRGMHDLDDRAFMGKGIMSQGEGITWP